MEGRILIKISKQNCEPCKRVETICTELKEDFEGFRYIELDYDMDDVSKYNVKKVPLFVLIENERELDRIESSNPETIYLWFSKLMMIF